MIPAPDRFLQATAALLVASAVLIGPSLVGLGASLVLALALAALGGGLYAARHRLAAVGRVAGLPLGQSFAVAWIGPLLGGLVVLLALDATPGELQALGGLCGLLGMANYFLRPVYGLLVAAWRSIGRTLG